jgi:hypothetical protein
MVGLCLLYVDERVRHEGYDIELMAARRLGEIPAVPSSYINPLQPALAAGPYAAPPNRPLPPANRQGPLFGRSESGSPPAKRSPGSILGLD